MIVIHSWIMITTINTQYIIITHKKFDYSDALVMGGIPKLYLLQLIFSQLFFS